jgi:hypothetical protein
MDISSRRFHPKRDDIRKESFQWLTASGASDEEATRKQRV